MAHNTSLNDLPQENKLNIFSRLPVESVLNCRRVCKPWKNLLRFKNKNTHFADLHLHYQLSRSRGLIKQQKPLDSSEPDISHDGSGFSNMSLVVFSEKKFYYAESYDYGDDVYYKTRRINIKFPSDACGFVGSCNGLICLSARIKEDNFLHFYDHSKFWIDKEKNYLYWYNHPSRDTPSEGDEPKYICNPITREIVTLPAYTNNTRYKIYIVHGFGYHPIRNEYKVVRISYRMIRKNPLGAKGKIEVYTVGNGSRWRNVGEIDYLIAPSDENRNNCVNGSLHWLKYETGEIMAFNLADEELQLVHTPPGLPSDGQKVLSSRVFVMRGCLCLAYQYEKRGDLWMLKKNELENAVINNVHNAKDQYYKSRNWIKELEIGYPNVNDFWKIFGLTEKGEVLLKHVQGLLTQYHSEKSGKTFKTKHDNSQFFSRVISHINSFVSLKALGEVNVYTCKGSRNDNDDGGKKEILIKRPRAVFASDFEDYYTL